MNVPDRLPNRLIRLFLGLALFGAGIALTVRARLGLDGWNVLHEGVAERSGLPFGWIVIGTAVLVLLLWIPLRQRPGVGTIANVVVVGPAADALLWLLPAPENLPLRVALLVAGIVLTAIATALYIGAGLGPGPRDGLMTGWAARGHSLRMGRTVIEASVLVAGVSLGGTVGVGTVVFTLTIGPLAHWFLPRLTPGPRAEASHPTWTHDSSAPTDAACSPPSNETAAPNSPRSPTSGNRTCG